MERVAQDLGAGVKFMRERFDKVLLLGNSGGAASSTSGYTAGDCRIALRALNPETLATV
jgi:hypothetical protein